MWAGAEVKSAKFVKGSVQTVDRCALALFELAMGEARAMREDESSLPASRRTQRDAVLPVDKWIDLQLLSATKLHELVSAPSRAGAALTNTRRPSKCRAASAPTDATSTC